MTTGVLGGTPIFQSWTPQGQFNVGGLLYTYQGGTNTPIAVYHDANLTTPWTNPVVLDAYGAAVIYLSPGQAYKFNVTDQYGNQIPDFPVDNINNAFGLSQSLIPTSSNTYNIGSPAFTWANGYFGTSLSVSGLPVVTYPQTTAEQTALVVPTNSLYPP